MNERENHNLYTRNMENYERENHNLYTHKYRNMENYERENHNLYTRNGKLWKTMKL